MSIPSILERIIHQKWEEIARDRGAVPLAAVQVEASLAAPPRDFAGALRGPRISLIAEVKRASPSKGLLHPDLDPVALAREYEANGAAAVSVLTDRHFFLGSLDDLRAVRQSINLPVLCKDFFLEPYQVYRARAVGADAILLIVAALDNEVLQVLVQLAESLGMAALIEVHDAEELERALSVQRVQSHLIIGVNNRNLHSFEVSLSTTEGLRPLVPPETILVSESGIHCRADVERLANAGASAILVGEALVRAQNAGAKIRELLG